MVALLAAPVVADAAPKKPGTARVRTAKRAPAPAIVVAATVPALDPALDPAVEAAIATAIRGAAHGAIGRFYATRGYRPLWMARGHPDAAADALIADLASADADGLRPYDVAGLRAAVADAASGDPRALAVAEVKLSDAFARYVRDQRRPRGAAIEYADRDLTPPRKLKPEAVLRAAAFPKSFAGYITGMEWMSPQYVRLRTLALSAAHSGAGEGDLDRLRRNLDRARILPGPWTRHIEVDASAARLWFYEAGEQVGTMRVVVGAKETQTPLLVGRVQWAILNPYWNVPDYLAQGSIAHKVLAGRSLATMRMEALTDWSADARPLAADAIDWHAVADGRQVIRLRQLPGPANSMGRVKFLFPNNDGIYLHDTPERELLTRDERHLSNGCIRLENAAALGKWLLQRALPTVKTPETAVALPVSVPVYLTYLTPIDDNGRLAFRPDIYGRDA